MRYADIRECDIHNGPGVRLTLWVQGCTLRCKGCHNPDCQPFEGGHEYTKEIEDTIVSRMKTTFQDLSVLGGEPLDDLNIDKVTDLVRRVRQETPSKHIMLWTGHLYEDYKDHEIMNYLDVIIDGKFEEDKYDAHLSYRGSSNQRVIDVKKSREEGHAVLADSLLVKDGEFNA